ncbi:hypothetical protein ACTXT7_014350, partial [Hymenolepis weldensis]
MLLSVKNECQQLMKRRALESVSVFLFLTIFPDAMLMSNAQVLLDYQKGSQYGEPTVFVIKRVKNRTFDEENSQRLGLWAPVGTFEPYYRTEFTILILLVLSCLILFTILGNILVVAAVFHERSLHMLQLLDRKSCLRRLDGGHHGDADQCTRWRFHQM